MENNNEYKNEIFYSSKILSDSLIELIKECKEEVQLKRTK